MNNIEERVLGFIRNQIFEINGLNPELISYEFSLSTDNRSLVAEEAADVFYAFSQEFNVTFENLDFRKYFPQTGIIFLPNCILPDYMKTDHHHAAPLTINMLVDAAKCGYWRF